MLAVDGAVVAVQFDNFGLDPVTVLEKVGLRDAAFKLFDIDASHIELSPTKVSLVLAWLSSEVAEPVRVPLTILLSPIVRKRLDKYRAAASQNASDSTTRTDDVKKPPPSP